MKKEDNNKMQIISYSPRALALVGDAETQKKNKTKLIELGGSYNPRLTCGAGWVFSRRKLGGAGLRALTKFVTAHGGTGLSKKDEDFNKYLLTNKNPATKIG